MFRDRPDEPRLRHARDHTSDATAEGSHGGIAWGQFLRAIVDGGIIPGEATLEDEVIDEGDALIDGEPVSDKVHKVLEHGLEVRVARDGDGDVDEGGEAGPDEARHGLGAAGEDLRRQADGVQVRAVVGDDGEGEDDEAEAAEARADAGNQHGREEAADPGFIVATLVGVVAVGDGGGCHDGDAEHLGEEQGDDEADPGGEEDFAAGLRGGLVDGVVRGEGGPTRAEAVNRGTEGEYVAEFGFAGAHGKVTEVARAGEEAEDDEENDEGWDPGVELVEMDDFVAEDGDEECAYGDDQDASPAGDVVVNGVYDLGANDDVDARPSDAGEDVEKGNFGTSLVGRQNARENHIPILTPLPNQNLERTI